MLSSAVLKEIEVAPDSEMPVDLLNQSVAIGIFPGVKKGGYILGGQYGRGVIIKKNDMNKWSAPALFKIHGGSIGFQIGIQEVDLILFFVDEASFNDILESGYNVGVNISASAGPVGRDLSKDPKENIIAYSRSKGLFAGAIISGVKLSFDFEASQDYYGDAFNAKMILINNEVEKMPETAIKLVNIAQNLTKGTYTYDNRN
ncbi:MAG: hypothetical protein ACD_79C00416G0001, partial [uncultured bacterium]